MGIGHSTKYVYNILRNKGTSRSSWRKANSPGALMPKINGAFASTKSYFLWAIKKKYCIKVLT